MPKLKLSSPTSVLVNDSYIELKQIDTSQLNFPVHIFPKTIKDIIEGLEKTSNFPTGATSATFLFNISTIIGNKRKVYLKDTWIDGCTLWFAIIGKRGTMKTHAVDYMLRPLNKKENEFAETYELEISEFNKYTDEQKKTYRKETGNFEPIRRQIIVKNSTREGLEWLMYQNKHGIGMYKDELFGLFEETKNYSANGVMEFYLDIFNGKIIIVNRRHANTFTVKSPFMGILGSIQPEKMMRVASEYTDNGVVDRFLYVPTTDETPIFTLDDIHDLYKDNYTNFINSFYNRFEREEEEKILTFSNESKQIILSRMKSFEDYKNDDDTSEPMSNYISKIITYFIRFTIIFNEINNRGDIILPESVEESFELCIYFIGTGEKTFAGFEAQNGLSIICKRANAKTKSEKIKAILNKLPDIDTKTLIQYTGATKGLVSQVKKV